MSMMSDSLDERLDSKSRRRRAALAAGLLTVLPLMFHMLHMVEQQLGEWTIVVGHGLIWVLALRPVSIADRLPSSWDTAPAVALVLASDVALVLDHHILVPCLLTALAWGWIGLAVLFPPLATCTGSGARRLLRPAASAGTAVSRTVERTFDPPYQAMRRLITRIAAPDAAQLAGTDDRTQDDAPDEAGLTWWRRYRTPFLCWLGIAAVSNWLLNLGGQTCPYCQGIAAKDLTGLSIVQISPDWYGHWSGWDSIYYKDIALNGLNWVKDSQDGSTVAWFPLYPLIMRQLNRLVDLQLAGVLITLLSGLAVALLYWHWLTLRGLTGRKRSAAFWMLMIYPYAFMFYGAVYADTLGLGLTLGALVLVEKNRYVWAGIVGAFATAARPTALPIIAGLMVLVLERDGVITWPGSAYVHESARTWGVHRDRLRWRQSGVFLSLGGVGSMAYYCWRRWDQPLLFYTVESYWGHGSMLSIRTWLKINYIGSRGNVGDGLYASINAVIAAMLLGTAILLVAPVARRHGLGYAALVSGVIASSIVGAWHFSPGGRHLLFAFPCAALVGEWLAERRRLRILTLSVFAVGCLGLTVMFSRGQPAIGW